MHFFWPGVGEGALTGRVSERVERKGGGSGANIVKCSSEVRKGRDGCCGRGRGRGKRRKGMGVQERVIGGI